MTLPFAALLLALPLSATDAPALPQQPPPEALAPFVPAGRARVFTGESLYEQIDGGAELYLELGFEALSVRRYRHGTDEVTVEVYRMSDPTAALGAYLAKAGRETPDTSLTHRNSAGRYELLAVKGSTLVVLGNLSGKADTMPVLGRAAAALLGTAARADVPATSLLPVEGREPGSLRLIRGPVGLQPFVTLGDGDILRLAGKVTGAGALYADGTTRLAFAYPDAVAARKAFKVVTSGLDPTLKRLSGDDDRLVFTEPSGRKGTLTVDDARLLLELALPSSRP